MRRRSRTVAAAQLFLPLLLGEDCEWDDCTAVVVMSALLSMPLLANMMTLPQCCLLACAVVHLRWQFCMWHADCAVSHWFQPTA